MEARHVSLRPLDSGDLDIVMRLWTDPAVRKYLGGPLTDPGSVKRRFDGMLAATRGEGRFFAVESEGRACGIVSIDRYHDGVRHELSYQFIPEAWGRGIASRAIMELLGNEASRYRRLVAETQEANVASRRLLRRLGFREIARLSRFGARQVVYELKK
jgi:ribosomal-protein-alanine N-acetyltransferase